MLLLEGGYDVVVVDNLNNASPRVEGRILELVGEEAGKRLDVRVMDLLDEPRLAALCAEKKFDSCIHFAGYKAVGESVEKPLAYYRNNIVSTLNVVECLQAHGCKSIIFSGSCTVYGNPKDVPIHEGSDLEAINPYGRTKLYQEHLFRDLCASDPEWKVVVLRYFNPVGAHPSGRLGEDPKGIPNNLMPYIQQVAVGRREKLSVFGGDYPTRDGSGIRDYIHVEDLAVGHLSALRKMEASAPALRVYNLGTGKGYSVLDMVRAMEKAAGRTIPYKIVARRPGDVATVYADTRKAADELGWTAELGLDEMCRDLWTWQSANPMGFVDGSAEL